MKKIIYMSEYPRAFQNAHSYVWEVQNTTALAIDEQIKGWKKYHKARIFGGSYDKNPDGTDAIMTRAVGLEFKNEETFWMFLMAWS